MRLNTKKTRIILVVFAVICALGSSSASAPLVWSGEGVNDALREEFASNAPKAWTQFRLKITSNRKAHVQKTIHTRNENRGTDVRTPVESKYYASGKLRFSSHDAVVESERLCTVTGLNSKYGFQMLRKGDLSWKLNEVEILEEDYKPFQTADLEIRPRNNMEPVEYSRGTFAIEERLIFWECQSKLTLSDFQTLLTPSRSDKTQNLVE